MKIRHTHLLIVLLSSNLLYAQSSSNGVVGRTSFEDLPNGTEFTKDSWTSLGFNVRWVSGFDQHRAFIDNAFANTGKNSLRVKYPASGFGPDQTGAQAPLEVPPAPQYYASYSIRFSDNFEWGGRHEGGKLPGLAGGANCSGCKVCDGTNGFTARLMWRKGGKGVIYLYHMDKVNRCGDDFTLQNEDGNDLYFAKNRWYQIIERVKVNSDSSHNGEVEVWIDKKHAFLKTGIKFVTNGDQVDKLYFSSFHGGDSVEWAPSVDCYIWYDDFIITRNPGDIFGKATPLQTSPR